MTKNFGSTFTKQFGLIPNDVWIGALTGLSPDRIKIGFGRMAKDFRYEEFPPKAIAFRRLCLPTAEELGLPSDDEAFDQIILKKPNKHPAVIFTMHKYLDLNEIRNSNLNTKQARAIFDKAWAKTVEHVANGGDIELSGFRLEDNPPGKPVSRDVKQANLNALKEFLA